MKSGTQIKKLAASLLQEMFIEHRKVMSKWAAITGQSSQLDSGYIAQHLISLLSGKRGVGWRGKGLDLEDGSEVKSASSIDGVDVPRWNHNFSSPKKVDEWLASPTIYYVLFDTPERSSQRLRVRIWAVTPAIDIAYRTVLQRWRDAPRKSNNFQLHPPVGKDSNLATNECGNLELPLMFHAEENGKGKLSSNCSKPHNFLFAFYTRETRDCNVPIKAVLSARPVFAATRDRRQVKPYSKNARSSGRAFCLYPPCVGGKQLVTWSLNSAT
jgi:hypothetical protein